MRIAEAASSMRQSALAREPTTVALVGAASTAAGHAASSFAAGVGRQLYRIDLSAVVSKYIGETEKNLELLFAEAEAKNWVLFFDEADALFGKRTEVRDAHDRYSHVEIDELLRLLEGYRGILLLSVQTEDRLRRLRARRKRLVLPHRHG